MNKFEQLLAGHSVQDYASRLAQEKATVAEIGYCPNFEDASYFARFFKRETGISPIAFRQQFRKKYQVSTK